MFSNKQYLEFFLNAQKNSLDIVEVSVVETLGSTYAKVGNMMLINSNFEFIGVLGSPALHKKFIELAKEAFSSKERISYENVPKDKTSGHGVSRFLIEAYFFKEEYSSLKLCLDNLGKTRVRSLEGKSIEFIQKDSKTRLEDGKFYQNIDSVFSLLVFGSGAHVSSLVSMANLMGWKTTLIDIAYKEGYVEGFDEVIILEKLEDILTMDLNSYDASVILSHSPKTDDTYLEGLLKSNINYIGILGNKKNMQKKALEFDLKDFNRFFAPVGFDLGGITHESIALSICSQIEARRNGKI